ncbi:MAG: 50S ribosomal protein L22 [Candidatus Bipolaricaulota bacterium]|nr:50S ribosomal protein L22 [Candidatus Bipolaricaulota bacterium]
MEARAVAKWIRISPLKARLLTKEIQGKPVDEALKLTRFARVKAATPVRKCLESAIANAEHNYGMDVDALWVKEARVDKGPFLKRLRPGSRGKVSIRKRRMSHITVVVSDDPRPLTTREQKESGASSQQKEG